MDYAQCALFDDQPNSRSVWSLGIGCAARSPHFAPPQAARPSHMSQVASRLVSERPIQTLRRFTTNVLFLSPRTVVGAAVPATGSPTPMRCRLRGHRPGRIFDSTGRRAAGRLSASGRNSSASERRRGRHVVAADESVALAMARYSVGTMTDQCEKRLLISYASSHCP